MLPMALFWLGGRRSVVASPSGVDGATLSTYRWRPDTEDESLALVYGLRKSLQPRSVNRSPLTAHRSPLTLP